MSLFGSATFGGFTEALTSSGLAEAAEALIATATSSNNNDASEENGGTIKDGEEDDEELFKTSFGYFLFPSDPLADLCQLLKENKITSVKTDEYMVLESNTSKVFAKALKENTSVKILHLLLSKESVRETLCDDSCRALSKGMGQYHENRLTELNMSIFPETPKGRFYLMQVLSHQTLHLEKLTLLSCFLQQPTDQQDDHTLLTFLQNSKACKDLTILCVERTQPPDFTLLSKAVMASASLERLVLQSSIHNEWDQSHFQSGLEALIAAVAMTLESIEISNIDLTSCINALQQIMEPSSTVTQISLKNCHLTSTDVKSLNLQQHSSLTSLCLNGGLAKHGIGNDGAMYLAQSVLLPPEGSTTTSSLQSLTLQSAGIGNDGTVFLANALRMNTTLQFLDLRHNTAISEAGLVALGNALLDNHALVTLWVLETVSNPSVAALEAFSIGIETNCKLTSILSSNDSLPKKQTRDIRSLWERLLLLVQFNADKNFDAKSTYCNEMHAAASAQEATSVSIQSLDDSGTSCTVCDGNAKAGYVKCQTMNHVICISCIEKHLAKSYGQKELSCPVANCISPPFSVSKDLYGKVSAEHYECHCKEMFQILVVQD